MFILYIIYFNIFFKLELVRKLLYGKKNNLKPEINFITFVPKVDITRNKTKLSKIR